MNPDKKLLYKKLKDKRNTQDWSEVQSIPLPASKTSSKKSSPALEPLKLVGSNRPDLIIKENLKEDSKGEFKKEPLQSENKTLVNPKPPWSEGEASSSIEGGSFVEKSLHGIKRKSQYNQFLLKREIENLNLKHTQKTLGLTKKHKKSLIALKKGYEAQLKNKQTQFEQSLKTLKDQHKAKLKAKNLDNKKTMKALRRQLRLQPPSDFSLKKKLIEAVVHFKKEHDKKLRQIKINHEEALAAREAAYKEALSQIKGDFKDQIIEIKTQQNSKLKAVHLQYKEKIEGLKNKKAWQNLKALTKQVEELKNKKVNQDALAEEEAKKHQSEMLSLGENYKKEINTLKEQIQKAGQEIARRTDELQTYTHQEEELHTLRGRVLAHQTENTSLNRQMSEYKNQIEDLNRDKNQFLKQKEEQHKKQIAELTSKHYEEKISIRSESDRKLSEMQMSFHTEKMDWIQKIQSAKSENKTAHQELIEKMENDFKNQTAEMKAEHEQNQRELSEAKTKELKEVQYTLNEKLEDHRQKYSKQIEDRERAHSERIMELKTSHENHILSMTREAEKSFIEERVKNEKLIRLYDADTESMKKDIALLQNSLNMKKDSANKLFGENKILSNRVQSILSENQTLKEQNSVLKEAFDELNSKLEQKLEQILSLQKLNQHLSQSLFKAKKVKTKSRGVSSGVKDKERESLLSDLRLY